METTDTAALAQPRPAEPPHLTRWRALLRSPWAWFVMAGFVVLLGICVADTFAPVNLDEGVFLTIAQEILHGRLPYRDVFDHKGPAIYYLLAGVLALTGHLPLTAQVVLARMLGVGANCATAIGMVILGKRWWRLEVGVLAALLWLAALPLYLGDSVLTEPFSTAPVVWAVVLVARRADMRAAWCAGLLVAFGSLFKQTSVLAVPGLALLLLALTAPPGTWWRVCARQATKLLALAAGLALPWLAVSLFFAAAGALQPMVSQVVWANLHYPPDSFETIKTNLLAAITGDPILPLLPPLVAAVGLARWLPRPGRVAQISSLGAVVAAILYGCNLIPFFSHAFLHYWLPVAPWAALLAALGLGAAFTWAQPRLARAFRSRSLLAASRLRFARVGLQTLLAVLLLALVLLAGTARLVATFQAGSAALHTQLAAGAWIACHTPPGARLLIAPAEPEYYYLSGQQPVTFYLYLFPVNTTPALLAQVSNELRSQQFDVVVWENVPAAVYVGIHQQLIAQYHPVASDASEQLILYLPNQPDNKDRSQHTACASGDH